MKKSAPLPLNDGRSAHMDVMRRIGDARSDLDRLSDSLDAREIRSHLARLGLPTILACFALLVGCPPAPAPKAPVVDASDAAIVGDGPITPCQAAFDALARIGCPVDYAVLARIDGNPGFLLEPSGKSLNCADLATVQTVADAKALGVHCGD